MNCLYPRRATLFSDDLFRSPVLLLFLRILVRDGHLDLRKESLNWKASGEVYFRLCRCLYRKYIERSPKQYSNGDFLKAMARVGKLAWDRSMLSTKRHLLRRNELIKQAGPEAFGYGFLIGHEDYRLFGDETTDIFVTFPHQSLQEFLGACFGHSVLAIAWRV